MAFFDKLKTFVGMHGCKVAITELERQTPGNVTFPVTDTVFKGKYCITSEGDCNILWHKHEVVVFKKHSDGREEEIVVAENMYNEKSSLIGFEVNNFPHDMKPNETVNMGFVITNVDLPATLKKLGYNTPQEATDVKFFVRVIINVKGTPMDPEAKEYFKITF